MPRSKDTNPAGTTYDKLRDDIRALESLLALAPPQAPGHRAQASTTLASRLKHAQRRLIPSSIDATQESRRKQDIPYLRLPTAASRRDPSPKQSTAQISTRGDDHKSASSKSIEFPIPIRATPTDVPIDQSNASSYSEGHPYTDGPTTLSPQPYSDDEWGHVKTVGGRLSVADTTSGSKRKRRGREKQHSDDREYRHKTYSLEVKKERDRVPKTPRALTRSCFTSDGTQKPDE